MPEPAVVTVTVQRVTVNVPGTALLSLSGEPEPEPGQGCRPAGPSQWSLPTVTVAGAGADPGHERPGSSGGPGTRAKKVREGMSPTVW